MEYILFDFQSCKRVRNGHTRNKVPYFGKLSHVTLTTVQSEK